MVENEGVTYEEWWGMNLWWTAYVAWIYEDKELFKFARQFLISLGIDLCTKTYDQFLKLNTPILVENHLAPDDIYSIMKDIREVICIWEKPNNNNRG